MVLKESEVTKFIVKQFGSFLFEELDIKKPRQIFYEVKEIMNSGDLDVLIIDPFAPQEAIVLECKRIKVKIEENQYENVNKQKDLKKLVHQTNDRIKRGFHKVYLTVLIVCDGRNKIANNIFFNNPSSEIREPIYTSHYFDDLDERAGMLFLEPSQLTSKHYTEQAGMGLYEMRKPIPQRQPEELTDKLKLLISND